MPQLGYFSRIRADISQETGWYVTKQNQGDPFRFHCDGAEARTHRLEAQRNLTHQRGDLFHGQQ